MRLPSDLIREAIGLASIECVAKRLCVLAVLLCLGTTAAALVVHRSVERRLNRVYSPGISDIELPSDAASLARGERLVNTVAQCATCHGEDLGGRQMADDPWIGRLDAPNLTPGRGGLGSDYGMIDFVRSMRHGVRADGTTVFMMSARDYARFSDADLAAMFAHLRSVPPVDRSHRPVRIGWLARIAVFLGRAPELLSAEYVEARAGAQGPAPAPPERASAEYGEYLVAVSGCRICHHANLAGGRHPLALPEEPTPPDLTSSGVMRGWSEAQYLRAMRTGSTPDGRALDARYMPWPAYSRMSDTELRAIWRFLQSLATRSEQSG